MYVLCIEDDFALHGYRELNVYDNYEQALEVYHTYDGVYYQDLLFIKKI